MVYTVNGKFCDFSFYVASFDTENHFTETEPTAHNLTIAEAMDEFRKRSDLPWNVNVMLGMEFRVRPENYEGKETVGAIDLLQRVDGYLKIPDDYKTCDVTAQEALINKNSISVLKQYAEKILDESELGYKECENQIKDNLPNLTDREKIDEFLTNSVDEYGIDRVKDILTNSETSLGANFGKLAQRFSEIETKLLHSNLIYGEEETVMRDKAMSVTTEINRHNEFENNGMVSDDELSL